jgi:hypothetical protein
MKNTACHSKALHSDRPTHLHTSAAESGRTRNRRFHLSRTGLRVQLAAEGAFARLNEFFSSLLGENFFFKLPNFVQLLKGVLQTASKGCAFYEVTEPYIG